MSCLVRTTSLIVLVLLLAGIGLWATQAAAPPAAVRMAPAPMKKEQPAPLRDRDFRAALGKVYDFKGMDDRTTTLADALKFLAEKNNVTFDVNERAFKFEQLNDVQQVQIVEIAPLKAMKAPLASVLKKLLARIPVPSGAYFVIRRDTIEITTGQMIRYELKLPPSNDPQSDSFEPPPDLLWEEIRDETLGDAMQRIAEVADVTVFLDPRVKNKAATKITTTIRNLPVDVALELLADMGEMAVVPKASGYYVTTPENAAKLKPKKKPAAPRLVPMAPGG